MKRLNVSMLLSVVVAASACGDTLSQVLAIRAQVAAAIEVPEPELIVDETAPMANDELALFVSECNEEALEALNQDDGDLVIPTAPALPASSKDLPAACDEAARAADIVDRCGPLVATTSTASLTEALAGCTEGTTCHIQLPEGDFDSNGARLGCVVLEGAGEGTRIHGGVSVDAPSIIARVAIDDAYGAVSASADVLVSESLLTGGYEGLSASWEQFDVAVCRSRVAAGYAGVGQSWQAHRLTVAQSAIAACYEAVSTSWGSENLHAQGNLLFGGYVGVEIHHSLASAVVGNTIFGGYQAVAVSQWEEEAAQQDEVDYTPRIAGVFVSGNTILAGSMPVSDLDNDIVIEE
jgi:hypothetical protein